VPSHQCSLSSSSGGRNYLVADLGILSGMGIASGYAAALVLALFINSPDVVVRYSHPQGLWLLCPTISYWISHIWLKVSRNDIHEDPLVFALEDRASQLVVLASTLINVLSIKPARVAVTAAAGRTRAAAA